MAEKTKSILVADDEESVRSLLQRVLKKMGFTVVIAVDGEEALAKVRQESFALLIMDIRMPKLGGMEAFKILRLEYPHLPIIMMTAFSTVETTLEAMRLGAFDYLSKPFDISLIKAVVAKALSSNQEQPPLNSAPPEGEPARAFIGTSPAMQEVFKIIGRVSASDSSVLIQGESGTGKELVARTIHEYSNRKNMPFVTVNCGAVPEGLLESEFFGHEKGAFTGALARKAGKFEYANGGTIFLDEIGEMNPQLQVKLLRVLQEREFERIGGNESIPVDVRVIAATNKSFKQSLRDKTFRIDLFYRLNVVSIIIPPLRERKEDIPLLAAYFRDKYCSKFGKAPKPIPPPVMGILESYGWPGNVRELENAVEHAIVLGGGQIILAEDLPEEILEAAGQSPNPNGSENPGVSAGSGTSKENSLREAVKAVEKETIARALKKTKGNKLQAARILEISRRALQYKIEEYGIDTEER